MHSKILRHANDIVRRKNFSAKLKPEHKKFTLDALHGKFIFSILGKVDGTAKYIKLAFSRNVIDAKFLITAHTHTPI